jgi:16S rRNA (guanine527-N7)-methyltransferase
VDTTAIAQLLRPYIQLDETRLRDISIYIDLLLKWNARINLTAIRQPEGIIQRHFGESFFAANYLLAQAEVKNAIDLGSGAGFPGVPFAMLAPQVRVTLIESNHKKATFLKELAFSLGMENVEVFSGRGEKYSKTASVVTMRAVESFEKTLPLALKLVGPGGRIALMIGAGQVDAARGLARQVDWFHPEQVPGGHSRVLLTGTKIVKVE